MKSQVVQEVNEWGVLERNDLGSSGNELLANSLGDLWGLFILAGFIRFSCIECMNTAPIRLH